MSFQGLLTWLISGLGEFTRVGDAFAPLPLGATNWEVPRGKLGRIPAVSALPWLSGMLVKEGGPCSLGLW